MLQFVISEPTTFVDNVPESPWWRRVEVQPGVYEVTNVEWNSVPAVRVHLTGIVVADDLRSRFFGRIISEATKDTDVGKEFSFTLFFYRFQTEKDERFIEQ